MATRSEEAASLGTVPVIDSQTILAGRSEVIIRHEDQHYRLRLTKSGRLLLNK